MLTFVSSFFSPDHSATSQILYNILGINACHGDAAAYIIGVGKLLAAAKEERFRRIKHWAGFPSQAISYCLSEATIDLSDVGLSCESTIGQSR
jgi:predicted NodU family carbamoyl transferase